MSALVEPVTHGTGLAGRARLGVSLSNEVPVAETVRLARLAEALGLAEAWIPEVNHGRSGTSVAATVIAATNRIGVGIGVLNMFWRHPSLLAMEAATLDELSDGRLRFGVGPAVWSLRNLGEADARVSKPLTATVETLRILRALLRGDPGVDGAVFPVRADAHLDFQPLRRDLPLYVGAVNERMLEASGELADGVELGAITSPGYTRWARERILRGAARAGRTAQDVDLIACVLVSVARDGTAARDAVRPVLAHYLYRVEGVVTDTSGADPDAIADARRAWRELGREGAAARLSDALIDTFAAAGTPDRVHERLTDYVDAGLDGVLAWHVLGPDPDVGLRLLAKEVWR
jgi:5,10-methylenetetrahydromethanopterin reductase